MKRAARTSACATFLLLSLLGLAGSTLAQTTNDPLLRAMRDELSRSRGLKVLSLEAPYFIEYTVEDGESFEVSASLGGLISVRHDRFRIPEIKVRVGDYKFDNTDYVGSGSHFGTHYDIERFPVENSYEVMRRFLWLATDSAYKSAVEAISRKRAALKNVAINNPLDDFAKAEPLKKILEVRHAPLDEDAWSGRVRALSAIFDAYPAVKASGVELRALQTANYYLNSEGAEVRVPDNMIYLLARAEAQAPDGMMLHDAVVFQTLDFDRMPAEPELRRGIAALAGSMADRAGAPKGEDYSGPVLFEGIAGAQLFAEVLGANLALARRPVMEPGRNNSVPMSELEGRQGARILPEWFDVVDDPTQKEWRGRPLFGSYEVDREGVAPGPLSLVEKGVLKTFLLTRQPEQGFAGSNGRARLPGSFGANGAGISNLFVRATGTLPVADLKKQLIEMCRQRNKPYGMIVRRMDFPSSASVQEIRRLLSNSEQAGGRPVSAPVLVYKVYPDGREELVRGLRFRGLNARSLKDILAAGDDNNVFEFLNNQAPLALIGGANYVAESCAIAPSVLIDDVDLHPVDEELPKLPIVPAPDLRAEASHP
ncbi:MAG TPA: metallopeptidase TldD-related protein [Bryobacteraceae bacterium]|nr:metallopeptidase TldD-related protein [Bryobacteraceae bacterium]